MIPAAQTARTLAWSRLADHAAMLVERRTPTQSAVKPGDPVTVDGHGDGWLIAIGADRARSMVHGVHTISAAGAVHRRIEA